MFRLGFKVEVRLGGQGLIGTIRVTEMGKVLTKIVNDDVCRKGYVFQCFQAACRVTAFL